jgi:hypothetical protein
LEGELCKIAAYLNQEELRKFRLMVKARGLSESMFIREMLGFEIRPRGAPKGPRKNRAKQAKPAKRKQPVKKREHRVRTQSQRASQLSFLD